MGEVIRLDNVSLWRRTQEEFSYDLKKTVLSFVEGKRRQPAKKLILDQISLAVDSGEKVGILGANGSGKSTLLKVICGILQPTDGSVRVRGKIAPLIELGAGFDLEDSVKNNIVLYGIFLGFSKEEMVAKTRSVLEFAELEDYSLAPVKALSSGMIARLGFAIATEVQPDILILDEVLSVGDEQFKNKAKQRLDKLWDASGSVLLVSHDLDSIQRSCQKAIWLDKGKIKFSGSADETIDYYLSFVRQITRSQQPQPAQVVPEAASLEPVMDEYESDAEGNGSNGLFKSAEVIGNEYAVLISGSIINSQDQVVTKVKIDEEVRVCMHYKILQQDNLKFVPNFHFYVDNDTRAFIVSPRTVRVLPPGDYIAECKIPGNFFNDGAYTISLALSSFEPMVKVHFDAAHAITFTVIDSVKDNPGRHGYTGAIPGIVRPQFKWETIEIQPN